MTSSSLGQDGCPNPPIGENSPEGWLEQVYTIILQMRTAYPLEIGKGEPVLDAIKTSSEVWPVF